MISTRVAGLVAGIALAIGLIVGAAGVIVVRETGTPVAPAVDWAGHLQAMNSMMGGPGGMMGGSGGMLGGSPGMGPGMMGSDGATMPDWMLQHHGLGSPEAAP